jgi:hypothetical protein
MMSPRYVALVAAAVLMLGVASPAAGSNFGGHYLDSSCCFMYGTRADIGSPASDFTLAPFTIGVVRVSSESSFSLAQTGFGQTNGQAIDNSCSSSTLKNYYEIILPNILPGICGWVGTTGYGVANKYSSFKDNSSDTWWDVAVNGVVKQRADLKFQTATRSVASGEITGSGNQSSGHLYGCYGCNGNLAWQRATLPASQSWFTIQSSNPLNDDGRWTIGPGGSPFTISHPYP